MAGLNIYTSNRLEVLSHALASVLSKVPPDVFAKEIVIVQSRGMARWLSYEIARQHTICANVEFPFPRSFAYRLLARLNGSTAKDSPWDPEVLLCRLNQEQVYFPVRRKPGQQVQVKFWQHRHPEQANALWQMAE